MNICPRCKVDIPDGMYHWCGTSEVPDYSVVLERIAVALEKIATVLEVKP